MPANKDQLLRYQVLNACFKNTSRLYDINTLVECCQKESMAIYGKSVSKRSIQNDIHLLQYSPFNVEFDEGLRKSGYYRYADTSFNLEVVANLSKKEKTALHDTIELLRPMCSDPDTATPLMQWMFASLQRLESGKVLAEKAPCVSFENNELLAGMGNFNFLLECIMNRQPICFRYRSFKWKEAQEIKVHPYYLKQFNGRWYLLGSQDGYDTIGTYAIDRILTVKVWKTPYKPTKVDFSAFFANTFGVTLNLDEKPEKIVLKIDGNRYPYVETKPFSEKQKVIKRSKDSCVIEFPMRINLEFISELLSFGCDLEVLEPLSLREIMAQRVQKMSEAYGIVPKDCTKKM